MTKRSTKRPRLIRCEIRYNVRQGAWYYREKADGAWFPYNEGFPKAAFVKDTIWQLRQDVKTGKCFSLRIYKKNGRVQEERTYPRSADPKSKG